MEISGAGKQWGSDQLTSPHNAHAFPEGRTTLASTKALEGPDMFFHRKSCGFLLLSARTCSFPRKIRRFAFCKSLGGLISNKKLLPQDATLPQLELEACKLRRLSHLSWPYSCDLFRSFPSRFHGTWPLQVCNFASLIPGGATLLIFILPAVPERRCL